MKWTSDDIQLVERLIEIKNKGYYASGQEVTDVYNRVLEKSVNVTNCGTCIRNRITELEASLSSFKRTLMDNDKAEENKALTEAEMMKERMAKVRAARKINNQKG